jgi:hypothetical protein
VDGTLTLNSVTAFTPGADVIVNGELVVDNSGITFTGTVSGTGVIKTTGTGAITISAAVYTTTANGILANGLDTAVTAITGETALTDAALDLDDAFNNSAGTILGIGSVTLDGDSATAVQYTNDGTDGASVTVSSGITLAGTLTGTGAGGEDSSDLDGGTVFTLSLTGGGLDEVSIADGGYNESVQKLGIIEFAAVKLQYGDLIGPVLPAFHIGVNTKR